EKGGGVLKFGTEVVSAEDGSLAALLGASPGASVSVSIMLELLTTCFPKQIKTVSWRKKLQEMIPSYGKSLGADMLLCKEIRAYTSSMLKLDGIRDNSSYNRVF
ncbi:MAG: malate:quinone oxidoreductase, partial [Patescibacteria group bacterium]|nr:malate:quinone oxidoreductase [Patescibacteria group bacterium]